MENSMTEGLWYDLDPASNVKGKIFNRVLCEFQVPNNPKEFCVRGVPEGEEKKQSFILRFSETGKVGVHFSENQEE